ncbi:BC_2427 family protein [Paenisporosarcina sp. TG-14]|uniref:BC_2427 family protein n=1 Tax=Paenisporosarcina sp. TG-14 TaxID=1231057 RepID=UPI0002DDEAAA|nr:hypothetical protein [Paenisporosarcina sp. TG-14]
MKFPWDNKRNMQKSHFNQKKYGDNTMSYPWINYEEMAIIINKQKALFTLNATPDFQHINETNTEDSDGICESDTKQGSVETEKMGGLVETYRRKKRSKLNEKRTCYRKIKNSSDIRKSNTEIKYIDTVEVSDDLVEINKRKKRLKLRKKCNRRRKKLLQEPYRAYEAPTPDDVCKIDSPIELKHAGIHSTTIKIPYSTFSKIHSYLHPCIIDNTISVTEPKHYPEMKDDNLVNKYHHHECDDDFDTNHTNEIHQHLGVRSATIKIPFYAFAKIYNLLHPPSCAIFARNAPKDNLVDRIKVNLGTSQANEFCKHAGVHSKTIKIPYSTFSKIHSYLHPCIIDDTISAADSKHYPEKKDDNLVYKYHHHHGDDDCDTKLTNKIHKHLGVRSATIKIPFYAFAKIYNLLHPTSCAIFARNAPKDNLVDCIKVNLGTSQANEFCKHAGVHSKTIKIPYATFAKIHNYLHPCIIDNTISAADSKHYPVIKEDKLVNKYDDTKHTNEPCKHERVHITTIKIPFYAFAKIYNLLHPPNCAILSHKHSLKIEHVSKRDKYDDACESSNGHQFHKSSGVRSRAIKIPISTFVDIDNFLHPAIFGSTTQNTFKFIDHSKMLDTITYYHEQPYCHLVGFKSHEIILLTDPVYQAKEKDNNKSVVVPLHDPHSVKKRESHNHICPYHESLNIRVPVVVGEYSIEICLEKDVRFEEKINMVKEITKEVILTNCKFVPAGFSNATADGSREALSGKLFIEGYINQHIEYNAVHHGNENFIPKVPSFHSLHQKIVVDLLIDLLQVQKITFGQKET